MTQSKHSNAMAHGQGVCISTLQFITHHQVMHWPAHLVEPLMLPNVDITKRLMIIIIFLNYLYKVTL